MTSKALTLGAVAVVLTAGTYFVLHKIAPQKHVEAKQEKQGPAVDDVFAGGLNLAALDQEAAAAAPAPAEAAAEPAAEPAAEEAPAADGAAAEAPADAAAGDVAAASAGDMDAALPSDAAAAPAAAPAPVEAAPAAEPEPAPAPAPVAEAPKPKPAAKPAAKAPSKKSDSKKPLTPWWGAESPNSLSVVYAGSAAYKKAVVLMFSGSFDSAASADANIKVKDASGKAVSGKWEIGASNARMLVFPVQKNGRYSVSVGTGLTDRNNRKLAKKLQGPVQVQ